MMVLTSNPDPMFKNHVFSGGGPFRYEIGVQVENPKP